MNLAFLLAKRAAGSSKAQPKHTTPLASGEFIQIVNGLQDALEAVGMDSVVGLPQIAVIGGQSVGKSSVIEGIVGKHFLPTGQGIVTRRPILLHLVNTCSATSDTNDQSEWVDFAHLPGQRFDDFDDVRVEIEAETERECGTKSRVSQSPIALRIHSPHVVNLTLLDLPGISKVPVGDQPEDIEQQLRNLALQYIEHPNCLLLAVVAGNCDLASSDALALARQVDPERQRTIGVVTKLDLLDKGCHAMRILEGNAYPLRLGFVGVVCRSQRDVRSGKSFHEHSRAELNFFQTHKAYRAISHRCGIGYLAFSLNLIFMHHIKAVFPQLQARVAGLVEDTEAELKGYGQNISLEKGEQGLLVLNLFSSFSNKFIDTVEGKMKCDSSTPDQLVGRARIDYIFQTVFAQTIYGVDSVGGLTDRQILLAIQNAKGPRTTLFVPEQAFEMLVRIQIRKLESPSLQCVELVSEELQKVVLVIDLPEFARFVNLRERIFDVFREFLQRCLKSANDMIVNLIQSELAYVNVDHPDFIGGPKAAATVSKARRLESQPSAAALGSNPSVPREEQGLTRSMSGLIARFRGRAVSDPEQYSERQLSPQESAWPLCQAVTNDNGKFDLAKVPVNITPSGQRLTDREQCEVEVVKVLIGNYLGIVKKSVVDSVQKTIMHFVVNAVRDGIERECVSKLYKQNLFSVLLQESFDIEEQRARCRERLEVLRCVGLLAQMHLSALNRSMDSSKLDEVTADS